MQKNQLHEKEEIWILANYHLRIGGCELPPLYLEVIPITGMECNHWSQRPIIFFPGNLSSDGVLPQDPRHDGLHLNHAELVAGTLPYTSSKWHVSIGLVLEGAIHRVESVWVKFLWIGEKPLVTMQQWQQYSNLRFCRYLDSL